MTVAPFDRKSDNIKLAQEFAKLSSVLHQYRDARKCNPLQGNESQGHNPCHQY